MLSHVSGVFGSQEKIKVVPLTKYNHKILDYI